ncbi:hypothetical protein BD410DRAFT_456824 [Rickenella mellea]|uniref:DUF6533 domain-containing protein n=1 Tax=Rickenella mellea TaxID=50990 RepID=A0A4Y7PU29_9AGAM|nr:hypothetical protein BD410DRAFT_456824 [Rickenella mellea]
MDTGFSGELQTVILLLKQAKVDYVNVASTALLPYDVLITFGDEVRLMWGAKWNAGKILFFVTRYPVFIDCSLDLVLYLFSYLDPKLCAPIFKAVGWQSYLGILTAELILLMRTYAIYGRSRSVLIIFAIICSPFPTLVPCIPTSVNRVAFLDFFLLMAFELVVVILTAWKGIYQWRENQSPLMKTLVKDGVFYFFWLFAVSLANAVVLKVASPVYSGLLLQVQRVLHAMLSARVLLHIRDTADDDEPISGSNPRSLSWAAAPRKSKLTDIEFASSQSRSGSDTMEMQISTGEIRTSVGSTNVS